MKSDRTWSISELSREFKVTPRALRFYEDRGLLSPARDGVNRVFSVRDRARLKLILRGKRLGFQLQEIREMLDLYDMRDGNRRQMEIALRNYRERLIALERQREDLDAAVAELNQHIHWLEARIAEPEGSENSAVVRAFELEARRRLEEA
jgi:DNA-binding transcriptional MerR regulator